MSLLDAIRNNSQAMTQGQGVTDETSKVANLMRARTGKASTGSPIAQSNLGEQGAVATTNSTMQNQVAPAAAIQQAGLEQQQAGQQSQLAAQEQGIQQSRKFDSQQSQTKVDQILSDLERNKGTIDFQKDKAALEQVGQNLRLSNQKYVDELQREGSRMRLNDENSFAQEIARVGYGDNQKLLEKNLNNKSILKASDREFQMSMANLGLDASYQMFQNSAAGKAQAAQYTAAGSAITSGIGAYNTYQNKQTPVTPSASTAGGQSSVGDNPMFKSESGYRGGSN